MPTVGLKTGGIALTGAIISGAICAGPAAPAPAHTAAAAAKGHVASYSYGSGARQKLTAYWYTGTGTHPVVVMIHGGYWVSGSRGKWATKARWWARHGFTVVTMDYHYATQAHWSTQRSDVLKALSWIGDHAKGIRANADKIVLLGGSAGGQLATTVGTHGCGGCRVRGVVGLSPVADAYASWKAGHASQSAKRKKLATNAVKLAGCTPRRSNKRCWNRWIDMAARNHASSADAPMLLYNSKDDFVPSSQSNRLASALREKGVPATVRVVPGNKHGGGILAVTGVRSKVLAWVRART